MEAGRYDYTLVTSIINIFSSDPPRLTPACSLLLVACSMVVGEARRLLFLPWRGREEAYSMSGMVLPEVLKKFCQVFRDVFSSYNKCITNFHGLIYKYLMCLFLLSCALRNIHIYPNVLVLIYCCYAFKHDNG